MIEARIKRKKPVLFYYWGPTWVLGKIGDKVVRLDEPAYDKKIWDEMGRSEKPARATAYPQVPVSIGANAKFAARVPKLAAFLARYNTSAALISAALAHMRDTGADADKAAIHFLKANRVLWSKWLEPDAAARVMAALARS